MNYKLEKICNIVNGTFLQFSNNETIDHLLLDSRRVYFPSTSLFFALIGPRRNGHQFIPELRKKGVRNFIISEKIDTADFKDANIILVQETLKALQELAAYHRKQFDLPVIGITGSNGKTIVKEWMNQLLSKDYNIIRSPKSYNSQIGVPLSIWQLNEKHTLAIIEAGISQPGEMEKLEHIICPTIGVLTNIGEAHNEGFMNLEEKITEKFRLFSHADVLVCNKEILKLIRNKSNLLTDGITLFTWSKDDPHVGLFINQIEKRDFDTVISAIYGLRNININIPFTDDGSVENAITCWCLLLNLKVEQKVIADRMKDLSVVNMRLEMKSGINHCQIINDSYSADLSSLNIALNFLDQQSTIAGKTIILSDFLQTGIDVEELYRRIATSIIQHNVNRVIGIGENISLHLPPALNEQKIQQQYFLTTEAFIDHFLFSQFREEVILVKGARIFKFEKIVQMLEQKVHQTVLEINLTALVHNLKQYQHFLKPSTKMMVMVKAFSYGSGGAEIANILQYHKVDYLGVAYVDEGIELRKAGINLPIMVMNPEEVTFESLVEYNLEPEIYSFELFRKFDDFIKKEGLKQFPIHIEFETGMNRLGFLVKDVTMLAEYLKQTNSFKIQTVFSHLVASEDPGEDDFSKQQFNQFKNACDQLYQVLQYSFLKHIANSAAILRFPHMQMDMVRLGIGLYGIDSSVSGKINLEPIANLKSTVAQLRKLKAGETVSYNRMGLLKRDSLIATVRIGYADGYPHCLGNGIGKMLIKNKLAAVIGSVCMDMTMIDVTGITGVEEGDSVLVFGKELPVQRVAKWAETIPYEIMTGISQRVKRVYYEE